MNDIEYELRELFRAQTERVVTKMAAPKPVFQRARCRQMATVALVTLVALTLVGSSIVGLRGLLGY